MAEEEKSSKNIFGKVWKIFVGLVLVLGGLATYYLWWPQLIVLIKGGLGLLLIVMGAVFLLVGFTE